jgi:hypothetical protein
MEPMNSRMDLTRTVTRLSRPICAVLAAYSVMATLALEVPFAKPAGPAPAQSKPQTAATSTPGETAVPSDPPRVDSARVHKLYLEGDFDEAIALLESNLKGNRRYRHEDSVFIFKHLGVMYAAQYETREKGKYFMHRLLLVEPTAKIMDMYASDMIYMIFKNIQEEFEQNRMQLAGHSAGRGEPRPDSARPLKSGPREDTSEGKKWIWAGAALATVAAGVGAYYLLSDEPKNTTRTHEVAP